MPLKLFRKQKQFNIKNTKKKKQLNKYTTTKKKIREKKKRLMKKKIRIISMKKFKGEMEMDGFWRWSIIIIMNNNYFIIIIGKLSVDNK